MNAIFQGVVYQGFFQLLVVILLSPLVNGIIKKIKAFSQKRKGPPVLQLYFDLYKLLKKDRVISNTTSWIFIATPYIVLGSALVASFFVPVIPMLYAAKFSGDILLVISLLALGRFFLTLASLDAGSAFGGMGASREIMISFLFEPSMLVTVFTLGLISQKTSVYEIFKFSESLGLGIITPYYIFLFFALFIILIAETSRIPVDDPSTHLELTMVHEAMILEYSGKHLAFLELGATIKQFIFITMLCNIFIPISLDGFFSQSAYLYVILLFVFVIKVILLSIVVAIFEVFSVKMRLFRISELAILSFMASFIAFLEYFVLGGK